MSEKKVNMENAEAGNDECGINRRKKKYIRPDIQIKLVVCTFLVGLFCLVFNLQIPIISMASMDSVTQPHLQSLYNVLFVSFGISVLIAIPLSIWVGVVITFHFCGPIYRIKKYFTDLKTGRWDVPCSLRQKDELKDVVEEINSFVSISNGCHKKQHAILQDAFSILQQAGEESVDTEKVEELKQRIEEASVEFHSRFGEKSESPEKQTVEV